MPSGLNLGLGYLGASRLNLSWRRWPVQTTQYLSRNAERKRKRTTSFLLFFHIHKTGAWALYTHTKIRCSFVLACYFSGSFAECAAETLEWRRPRRRRRMIWSVVNTRTRALVVALLAYSPLPPLSSTPLFVFSRRTFIRSDSHGCMDVFLCEGGAECGRWARRLPRDASARRMCDDFIWPECPGRESRRARGAALQLPDCVIRREFVARFMAARIDSAERVNRVELNAL